MNKNNYIKEVDKITASDQLKNKISSLETVSQPKKKSARKKVAAIAACFLVVIMSTSIAPALLNTKKLSSLDSITDNGYNYYSDSSSDLEGGTASGSTAENSSASQKKPTLTTDRKTIKNAEVYIDTKNYSTFTTAFSQKVQQLQGYIEYSTENNRYDNLKFSAQTVRIPAENLEKFIGELEILGTVTSKTFGSKDITDSYIDIESRLNAVKTEEQTLLNLLKKADKLSDVLEIQQRLSSVRADIESMEAQLKNYDNQIEYSTVTVNITEVEREAEINDSFFGRVKERFLESLYGLGDFFEETAISILGGLPYILTVGIVAGIVIIIIKKVKKR